MTPLTLVPAAPRFDAVTAFGIGGLAVLMAAVVVWLRVRFERVAAGATATAVALWMLATGLVAASGVLARLDLTPPPVAVLIPLVFVVPIGIVASALGGRLAAAIPMTVLVGVQMFRLPLELLMHRAAGLGIMPTELSYSGSNFDIVTGISAALLFAIRRVTPVPRAVVWVWNVWGLGCLVMIAWIARTASPLVRGFGDDPDHLNTWVLYFPYVWLPTVLVVIALGGHLVLTRRLLSGRT